MIPGIFAAPMMAAPAASYLDLLAVQPRAVLSRRKMISSATSSMRVRRSSDDAESDIGFDGDNLDASALAAFVGANSGFVRTLYDQTGNGEAANETTASKQPRIVNAGSIDPMVVWDGSSDSMTISSLLAGSAYVGIYLKFKMPAGAGTRVIFETSVDFNNNPRTLLIISDSSAANRLSVATLNNTGSGQYRNGTFPLSAGANVQLTILLDRTLTGSNQIRVWANGSPLAQTVGMTENQTGVFSTHDAFIGARGGSSLFADLEIDTLAYYNADTSAIRASIEGIIAP